MYYFKYYIINYMIYWVNPNFRHGYANYAKYE